MYLLVKSGVQNFIANATHRGKLMNINHIDHELDSLIIYGIAGSSAIASGESEKNNNM